MCKYSLAKRNCKCGQVYVLGGDKETIMQDKDRRVSEKILQIHQQD